jgi:hypothetical protein
MTLKVQYIGNFEILLEKALGLNQRWVGGIHGEKKQRLKISRDC